MVSNYILHDYLYNMNDMCNAHVNYNKISIVLIFVFVMYIEIKLYNIGFIILHT